MFKRLGLLALFLAFLTGFEPGTGIRPAFGGVLRDAIALEQSWGRVERQDVQHALVWSGDYSGRLDGDFGPGTRGSIEAFQDRNDFWSTGYLTKAELIELKRQRRAATAAAGFAMRDFPELGLSIGLPEALLNAPLEQEYGLDFNDSRSGGLTALTLYSGGSGTGGDFRDLYDSAVARDRFNRDIYQVFRDDWFVFTGTMDGRVKQYTYMRNTSDGIRGFVFFYDTDDADRLDRVAVAMFNSLGTYAAVGGRVSTGVPPQFTPPRSAPRARTTEPPPVVPPSSGTVSGAAGSDGWPRKISTSEYGGIREPVSPPALRAEPEAEPEPRADYGTDRKDQPRGRRPRRADRAAAEDPIPRGRVTGSGSGFYVNGQGALLTNHHVIEGCRSLRINGKIPARTLRFDRDEDLALVQTDAGAETPYLPFRPTRARLNEDVTVIGFPFWGLLDDVNVTRGSVSSLVGLDGDRDMVQITAPVQSGNSGGPVLDAMGRVVGVVQSKLDALAIAEEMGEIAQNINFAIEGSIAQRFLTGAGAAFVLTADAVRLSPPDLAAQASEATVLVECME